MHVPCLRGGFAGEWWGVLCCSDEVFDELCMSLAYAVGLLASCGVFFAVVMGCFDERCLSLAYAVGLLGEWWVVLYCIGKVL